MEHTGNKAQQFGIGWDGATVNNDAGFMDAFDFLMADQTSSLWPETDTIMSWENRVLHSDGGSISSFLHNAYDMNNPSGLPMSPNFHPS